MCVQAVHALTVSCGLCDRCPRPHAEQQAQSLQRASAALESLCLLRTARQFRAAVCCLQRAVHRTACSSAGMGMDRKQAERGESRKAGRKTLLAAVLVAALAAVIPLAAIAQNLSAAPLVMPPATGASMLPTRLPDEEPAPCQGQTPARVLIDRVVPYPTDGQSVTVTLRNVGGQNANLTSWRLTDSDTRNVEAAQVCTSASTLALRVLFVLVVSIPAST